MANERSKTIRAQVVDHPQFMSIQNGLIDALNITKASGVGKGIAILGQSGVGKSTLIQSFSSQLEGLDESKFLRRIVFTEMPPNPTQKSLASSILAGMNDPFAYSRTHSSEEKRARIVKLFSELKTDILVIDEGQHIAKRPRKEQYDTGDWLKSLLNETHILVILAGLPELEQFIRANGQLRRRFSSSYTLDPFDLLDPKSRLNFLGVLQSFQLTLGVETIKLTSPDISQRMYFASCGLIDYVVKILEKCSYIADQESTDIHLGILSRAFKDEVWSSAPSERNPFEKDFDMRPLTFSGEPFDGYKSGFSG